jgi:hypothetical protein
MPGIPREVAEHELCIKWGSKPVQQRLRYFDDEMRKAIGKEIANLLVAGFIKEVYHSNWLANPVLVKKKNGKWRMCVDYTGFNKACPKDSFSFATHRPDSRLHVRMQDPLFSGCLLELSLDRDERVLPACDLFHRPVRHILLRHYAVRFEKCWCHLPVLHAEVFCR